MEGAKAGRGEGSNPTVKFQREKRSTDPDAMLSRKNRGRGAVLAYRSRLLSENRNGLVVSTLTYLSITVRRSAMLRC